MSTVAADAVAAAPPESVQPQATEPKNDNIFANALNHFVKAITPEPDSEIVTKEKKDEANPIEVVKDKITDVFGKFVEVITPVPDENPGTVRDVTTTTDTAVPPTEEKNDSEKNPFMNVFHKLVQVITPTPDLSIAATRPGGKVVLGAMDNDDDMVEGVGIPKYLHDALHVVTPSQRQLIITLYTEYGQEHLFHKKYFNAKSPPSMRRQLAQQLESLDREYVDGGLVGCIKNVRTLLNNSKNNVNPLDGWKPTLDTTTAGKAFTLGTPDYREMEAKGLPELGAVGFVLVAGGLGERLGYSGIKVRDEVIAVLFVDNGTFSSGEAKPTFCHKTSELKQHYFISL